MIFVTVGTHEQQFNRLIQKMDQLAAEKAIKEEIVMQTGSSTYIPQYCEYKKIFSYQEMLANVSRAHIVVSHGGPSSFIMSLQFGKVPIVVPRKKEYGEHVNNHQVEFVKQVAMRQKNIIPVYDVENLESILLEYDEKVKKLPPNIVSNNKEFNREFEKIVLHMFEK